MSIAKQITFYTAVWSPYSQRVHIALEEAKAKYTICQVDMHRNRPDWFRQVNPLGKIPVIAYGGPEVPPEQPSPQSEKLAESVALLEFIADTFPEAKLLPADPVLRARARAFISIYENYVSAVFRGVLFQGQPAEDFLGGLEQLQAALPPTGLAAGEWSIAEAAVTPFLARMGLYIGAGIGRYSAEDKVKLQEALASERFARLSKYIEDVRARPSFKASWESDAVQLEAAKAIARMRGPA